MFEVVLHKHFDIRTTCTSKVHVAGISHNVITAGHPAFEKAMLQSVRAILRINPMDIICK